MSTTLLLILLLLEWLSSIVSGFTVSQHCPCWNDSKHWGYSCSKRCCSSLIVRFAIHTLTRTQAWVDDKTSFDQEDFAWTYKTVPDEACGHYECQQDMIQGSIPKDLVGTYYKIGPGNFERGKTRYKHVLDGDGFVNAFCFENGKVSYSGRFVETEYYLQELSRDEILYRNVFGTQPAGGMLRNALDAHLKNVANTNILKWGGRLFCFWEGGKPYELDTDTLATLPFQESGPNHKLGLPGSFRGITLDQSGHVDRALNLGRFFTAHPHVLDDDTLVAFKAAVNPMTQNLEMEFIEYGPDWQPKGSSVCYALPKAPAAPHDFSVSDGYYCCFQNPLDLDIAPFLLGLQSPTESLQVPLDRPNILHLIPRKSNENKPSIRVEVPSYFNIHCVPKATQQDNNRLTMYSSGWDLRDERHFPAGKQRRVPFLGKWSGAVPDYGSGAVPPSLLYRTTVDLQTQRLVSHEQVIPGLVLEFITQDESNADIVYCSAHTLDYTSLPGTGLCKLDLSKPQEAEYWWAEPKMFTGEAIPVCKKNGMLGSWIVTLLLDAKTKRATLAILDSERFAQGPTCRIHLPHRLAYSLHGSFANQ